MKLFLSVPRKCVYFLTVLTRQDVESCQDVES